MGYFTEDVKTVLWNKQCAAANMRFNAKTEDDVQKYHNLTVIAEKLYKDLKQAEEDGIEFIRAHSDLVLEVNNVYERDSSSVSSCHNVDFRSWK